MTFHAAREHLAYVDPAGLDQHVQRLALLAATPQIAVDYSTARPTQAALDAVSAVACGRYVSFAGGVDKDISQAEADQLRSWGRAIFCYWEQDSGDALGTRAQGQNMASYAGDAVANQGGPVDGGVIFASCDTDATFDQAAAWFEGWADRRPPGLRGAYGGVKVISGLFDRGMIDFACQTRAWSGGVWDSRAQLQQYAWTSLSDGSQVDLLRIMAPNYGQWGATDMPLTQADIDAVTKAVHADVAAMLADPNHQYLPPIHAKLNSIARAVSTLSDDERNIIAAVTAGEADVEAAIAKVGASGPVTDWTAAAKAVVAELGTAVARGEQ